MTSLVSLLDLSVAFLLAMAAHATLIADARADAGPSPSFSESPHPCADKKAGDRCEGFLQSARTCYEVEERRRSYGRPRISQPKCRTIEWVNDHENIDVCLECLTEEQYKEKVRATARKF